MRKSLGFVRLPDRRLRRDGGIEYPLSLRMRLSGYPERPARRRPPCTVPIKTARATGLSTPDP